MFVGASLYVNVFVYVGVYLSVWLWKENEEMESEPTV